MSVWIKRRFRNHEAAELHNNSPSYGAGRWGSEVQRVLKSGEYVERDRRVHLSEMGAELVYVKGACKIAQLMKNIVSDAIPGLSFGVKVKPKAQIKEETALRLKAMKSRKITPNKRWPAPEQNFIPYLTPALFIPIRDYSNFTIEIGSDSESDFDSISVQSTSIKKRVALLELSKLEADIAKLKAEILLKEEGKKLTKKEFAHVSLD